MEQKTPDELIAQWKELAQRTATSQREAGELVTFHRCADQLEAALSAPSQTPAESERDACFAALGEAQQRLGELQRKYDSLLDDWREQDQALQDIYGATGHDGYINGAKDIAELAVALLEEGEVATTPHQETTEIPEGKPHDWRRDDASGRVYRCNHCLVRGDAPHGPICPKAPAVVVTPDPQTATIRICARCKMHVSLCSCPVGTRIGLEPQTAIREQVERLRETSGAAYGYNKAIDDVLALLADPLCSPVIDPARPEKGA